MNNVKGIFASLALLIVSSTMTAHAAFVETDWKVLGDKKATLDTNTGIEWLDLTETNSMSINYVSSRLTTDFLGWRFPTYDEMLNLVETLYPSVLPPHMRNLNTTSVGYGTNGADHLLFGARTPQYTYGLYATSNSTLLFGRNTQAGVMHFNYYWAPGSLNFSHAYAGVYLVSDGGVTLSSINNPSLNVNNPNSPYATADVMSPASLGSVAFTILLLGGGLLRRIRTKN